MFRTRLLAHLICFFECGIQSSTPHFRVQQGKLEYQLAFSTTGLIWSTVVNQLWRRFAPGFCHIIILLNVEFVQLRPIAVNPYARLITDTNAACRFPPLRYAPFLGPLWTDAVASFEHGGFWLAHRLWPRGAWICFPPAVGPCQPCVCAERDVPVLCGQSAVAMFRTRLLPHYYSFECGIRSTTPDCRCTG